MGLTSRETYRHCSPFTSKISPGGRATSALRDTLAFSVPNLLNVDRPRRFDATLHAMKEELQRRAQSLSRRKALLVRALSIGAEAAKHRFPESSTISSLPASIESENDEKKHEGQSSKPASIPSPPIGAIEALLRALRTVSDQYIILAVAYLAFQLLKSMRFTIVSAHLNSIPPASIKPHSSREDKTWPPRITFSAVRETRALRAPRSKRYPVTWGERQARDTLRWCRQGPVTITHEYPEAEEEQGLYEVAVTKNRSYTRSNRRNIGARSDGLRRERKLHGGRQALIIVHHKDTCWNADHCARVAIHHRSDPACPPLPNSLLPELQTVVVKEEASKQRPGRTKTKAKRAVIYND